MIEIFEEIASTSDELLGRLAKGENGIEGQWVVANRQTAGRGRQGRNWFDGTGNFMGSTFVRKTPGDPPLSTLALATGLAVLAAVSNYIDPPHHAKLKWPNDLLVAGAKLSGILLEGSRDGVVVGIGVNLQVAPKLPDRSTVALSRVGRAPDRDAFAVELADAFEREVELWRKDGLASLIARWLAAAHPIGTPLSVGEAGQDPLEGTFAGLAADGALQLRLADGSTRAIHAGDVNLS